MLQAQLVARTAAYVNFSRWVADCPRPFCGNAEKLKPGQRVFVCSVVECQLVAELVWPPDAVEIWRELLRRPMPSTRNWAPAAHRQAIACGVPDGQTAADLRAEFAGCDPITFAVTELVDQGATEIRGAAEAFEALAVSMQRRAAIESGC